MPIDAARIEQNGWRQGSILTLAASRPLVRENRERVSVPNFEIPDEARLIVASHDCDIVHRDIHEPRIEVCPAVALPGQMNGNFTGTRNPRRLHIELEIEGRMQAFELRAPTRFYLPRQILEDSAPDAVVRINPRHQEHFCHWLAKRHRRSALPTEFDRRIDRDTRTRIRAILRPLGDSVHSILVAINPDDVELLADEPYRLQIVALMETDDYADHARRSPVDAAIEQMEGLIEKCRGIELDACLVQSMGEMTIDEYRGFVTWDYDELSLAMEADLPAAVP